MSEASTSSTHDPNAQLAPGPPERPWRDLIRYVRDPLRFLGEINDRKEDVTRFRLGSRTYFFLRNPDDVRDILVTKQRAYPKGRAYEELSRLVGQGLLTSSGEMHLKQRRVIQPMFHTQRVAQYANLMSAEAERVAAGWEPGSTIDVSEEMSRLTLTVVGRALFDADVESEAPGVAQALEHSMAVFGRFLLPGGHLLWRLPLPSTRRFERARAHLDELIYGLIAARRASSLGGNDLLSLLLEARDTTDGSHMTDEQVRDEALTILLAGHETTAQALVWSWFLLSQNPDSERQLHAELDQVLDGKTAVFEDVARLEYTRAIVAESMRLYPPAWLIARRSIEDHALGGCRVPAESIVLASQFYLHRDERFFPDPLAFKPDRWREQAATDPASGAYFPFGAGTRMCVGERFAWTEAVLLLATLAQSWRLHLPAGQGVVPHPRVTLRPRDPLSARLERRREAG